ncbi:MAG: ABC transporter permease subunit [Treponema sp.]|nr:ABC transporter permease subunit [Treponema sp.]
MPLAKDYIGGMNMSGQVISTNIYPKPPGKLITNLKSMRKHYWLYIMCIPGVLYFFLFRYLPMWGILLSFQEFNPYAGFSNSPWVGFAQFTKFFRAPNFSQLMINTLLLSLYAIIFAFPAPIILALFLNELRSKVFKRTIQTLVYVPHFISWVIVASISFMLLSSTGPINSLLIALGASDSFPFLTSTDSFRTIIIVQTIWKESGWGTIVFLAALSGVDVEQYEAAIVDGATRLQQVWHITLPAIRSTIVILLILQMGNVLDNGFDQIYIQSNAGNRFVSDVLDTFTYREGIIGGFLSYTTAIGLFKSIIGIILIMGSNWLAKKAGESGIF